MHIEMLFAPSPRETILFTPLVSVFMLAYQLRIFEVPYYQAVGQLEFNSYFSAWYNIVITMTTVGFGDIYPGTYLGKSLILVTAAWGTFLMGLLITAVGSIFRLNDNESKSLNHLLLSREAASTITASMRYYSQKSKYLKN